MHTAVIKLNPLPNPIRAAAENHHLLAIGRIYLVIAAVVGGIVIRRVCLEFRRARIHQPIAGTTRRIAFRRTSSSVRPVRCAICRSENPYAFAFSSNSNHVNRGSKAHRAKATQATSPIANN